MRNRPDKWIWSAEVVHEPIVSVEQFEEVQRLIAAGSGRAVETAKVKPTTTRTFVLRSRLRCGICNRRMEAAWRHGSVYYLCRYRGAQAPPEGHVTTTYVREDAILHRLDGWLARVFDADRLDDTLDTLASAAVEADDEVEGRSRTLRAEAEATVADCETELSACRRHSSRVPFRRWSLPGSARPRPRSWRRNASWPRCRRPHRYAAPTVKNSPH